VARQGDIITTFAFDNSLYPMKDGINSEISKLNVETSKPEQVYQFMTTYFEFLRTKVKDNGREYYSNMLSAIKQSEKVWGDNGLLDNGSPVYLIMVVFGSHKGGKDKAKIATLKNAISSGTFRKSIEQNTQNENTYTQIQKTIDSQMMNFMLITSCLEEVKKEKLLQIVSYSKRSLVVDLGSERLELSKNFEEFIN
jgi:uncharacterized protein YcfJ